MPMPPIASPEHAAGSQAAFCSAEPLRARLLTKSCEWARYERQKAGSDAESSSCTMQAAAALGVDGHAEQPELAGAAKERVVEPLRPVELERLRLHLVPHERGAQLAERIVLRGRVEEGALRLGVVGDADR